MKIYFDTTCWYRPFESHSVQSRIDEQNAILEILEENENDNSTYEIVSCEMQVNQVYSKRNSLNTSANQRILLQSIIDSIETHTGNTTDRNPFNVSQFIDPLLQATNLADREDARHIITAWILKSDYFLTTDYSTILNHNTNRQIESFLDSQIHPILGLNGHVVEIRDPITGLRELKNS